MDGSAGFQESGESAASHARTGVWSALRQRSVSLPPDDLFSVLSHRRRRFAIYYLKNVDGPVELGALAEQVAAWENQKERHEITSDERKRVYTALQGSHLPPMDKAGLLHFDKDRGIIKPEAALYELDIYVDFVPSRDFHWSSYYLFLSVAGAIAFLMVALGVIPVGMVGLPQFTGFLLGVFLFSSVIHSWESRKKRLPDQERPPELDWQ